MTDPEGHSGLGSHIHGTAASYMLRVRGWGPGSHGEALQHRRPRKIKQTKTACARKSIQDRCLCQKSANQKPAAHYIEPYHGSLIEPFKDPFKSKPIVIIYVKSPTNLLWRTRGLNSRSLTAWNTGASKPKPRIP